MANEIQIRWDATPTDFSTLTNLHSLADGEIWQSGEHNDATPTDQIVRISYELIFVTPGAGDSLIFYWAYGDEASSNEIWSGSIGTSEGEITTAGPIAEVQQGCMRIWEHAFATSHGTTFKGAFDVWNFGPSWQLLIEANGAALTTGNRLRFRYGTPQVQ